jgi:PAS domain S-box-containing protein
VSRVPLRRLLLVVLALVAVLQVAAGALLYRRVQHQLEADLARRLVHVSTLLTFSVDASLVSQFQPGDEQLPAYGLVRRRLTRQAEAAGVTRVYVVDREPRTLVDTDEAHPPGRVRHATLAHRSELARAWAGQAVATRLYAGEDGALRLSAFAPLRGRDGQVAAIVGVDAPPAFFAALDVVRREMLLLGGTAVALIALAGLWVLRRAVARDYHEAVVGGLDVALLTCDAGGRVTLANTRAAEWLGTGGETLVGRRLDDVLAREEALRGFAGRVSSGDGRSASAELPLRGGLPGGGRVVAASASRLVHEGRPGLALSLIDITELRRAERRARENERLAALGGMAGGLLHELGNPLAALTMYLDLLRPLAPAGEGRDILESAQREDGRLRDFLEDFRVFAGLIPLRIGDVDLPALAEVSAEPLSWPPEIVRHVRGDGRCRGDARLLAHAVRNLLRNAVEALPSGGRIDVELEITSGEARVTVADDGAGLAPEELERALEPFHTTKPHGTGLGLMIARRVAELHGGQLSAESRPGAGARFTLRWPSHGRGGNSWPVS